MANTKVSGVYGVNENGEVVATGGTGSSNVKGFLPSNDVPVDDSGRMVIAGLTTFATDSSGSVIGLASPTYTITLPSLDKGITRPVKKAGKLVASFGNSSFGISASTAFGPTLTQAYTGYNADGTTAGVISRTGQPQMLKWGPITNGATGTEGISMTTGFFTTTLNGKLGIWVYVENAAGRGPAGSPTGNLILQVSTGTNFANCLNIQFNQNQIREGWNFLTFVMRDFSKYSPGSVTEDHPFQISVSVLGTGADANILANPMTRMQITSSSATSNGATFYLDSIWTDFDSQAQVVLGCDTSGADLVTYALPVFKQYGWIGYVAAPYRVWTTGSLQITDFNQTWANTANYTALKTVYDAGWEVINHTANHTRQGDSTDPALIHYEIEQSRAWYSAMGFKRGQEFYASPQSSTSRLSEKVISDAGIVMQRHAAQLCVMPTAWGVDNLKSIGSSDLGNTGGQGGYQQYSKIKKQLDAVVAYGGTWFPFWHNITVLGDTGSGEDLTGDNLLITYSAWKKTMDYIRTLELAGTLRVCKGMSGFYYGRG